MSNTINNQHITDEETMCTSLKKMITQCMPEIIYCENRSSDYIFGQELWESFTPDEQREIYECIQELVTSGALARGPEIRTTQ